MNTGKPGRLFISLPFDYSNGLMKSRNMKLILKFISIDKMNILDIKQRKRTRRKFHIRKRVYGTPERLRLTVYRSLNNIYAQIIDDLEGKTLVAASTLDKEVQAQIKPETKKIDQSVMVGIHLAKKALEKNITKVGFDRNGFLYHGRIKAFADGARKGGLDF